MRRSLIVRLAILPVALLAVLHGCGGTETGNPPSAPQETMTPPSRALELVGALCGKLESCSEAIDGEECALVVLADEDLAAAFGNPGEGLERLWDLLIAGPDQPVRVDAGALAACIDAIEALDCQSAAIQEVLLDGLLLDVERMVPQQHCPQVFTPAE